MSVTTGWRRPEPDEDATGHGAERNLGPASPDRAIPARASRQAVATGRRAARTAARYRAIGAALGATDLTCFALSASLLTVVTPGLWTGSQLTSVVLLGPVVWLVTFAILGLYRVRRLATSNTRDVVLAATLGSSVFVLVFADGRTSLRPAFLMMWSGTLALELLSRGFWNRGLKRMRHAGPLALRTLIIGTNDEARRLAASLLSRPSGFKPLGYVAALDGSAVGLDVVRSMQTLTSLVRDHAADCMFVVSTNVSEHELAMVARVARQEQVAVKVTASLPDILPSRVNLEVVDGVTTLALAPVRLTPGNAAMKRLFDLVVSACLLLVTLPMMLLIACLVRMSSRGPALFRQDRITRHGHLFSILKFRTMFVDDHVTPTGIDPTQTYFKMHDDPRVTRLGRFLRRTSLDELPQLWNVLRGDLSLIGPRPLWALQVDSATDAFQHRHEMRAGLTGWWQVNGRSGVDPESALRMDLFYIENWSLWLDLSILVRTIPALLTARGAY